MIRAKSSKVRVCASTICSAVVRQMWIVTMSTFYPLCRNSAVLGEIPALIADGVIRVLLGQFFIAKDTDAGATLGEHFVDVHAPSALRSCWKASKAR